MLRLLRKNPGKHVVAFVLTTLLLVSVFTPARMSLATVQARLLEQELLQRWPGDADADLLAALDRALATEPGSFEQFIDAFLDELGDVDSEKARDVLTRVLPGFSVYPSVSGAWLIELRRVLQADRAQSVRLLTEVPSSFVMRGWADAVARSPGAILCSNLGSNLTRGLIRTLISHWALGP